MNRRGFLRSVIVGSVGVSVPLTVISSPVTQAYPVSGMQLMYESQRKPHLFSFDDWVRFFEEVQRRVDEIKNEKI